MEYTKEQWLEDKDLAIEAIATHKQVGSDQEYIDAGVLLDNIAHGYQLFGDDDALKGE
jgi:hypothetical protein